MKVLFILGLLIPFGVIAVPVADPGPIPEADPSVSFMEPAGSLEERSAAPEPAGNLVRRSQYCSINGQDGNVACRRGPSTSSTRTSTAYAGNTYLFTCYKPGTCVFGNW